MEFESYKQFWNDKAATPESALAAVDGSASEEVVQITGRFTARQVATALELRPEDRILELGCGVGRIGRELAPHCTHWTGVDISERMIAHARDRLGHLGNPEFHQLERTRLDGVADGSLTKAYSVAVLCHMDKEDLYLYLQELHRTVRPGGLIYVETWNLAHPIGWKRWEYEVAHWRRSEQKQRKDVARNQFCTPDEFELYVRHAGFQPLASYADSPWVQIVAGRLSTARVARHRRRLAEAAAIASPLVRHCSADRGRDLRRHPSASWWRSGRTCDQPEAPVFGPSSSRCGASGPSAGASDRRAFSRDRFRLKPV
jgi:SAM-dependent methyltransferase